MLLFLPPVSRCTSPSPSKWNELAPCHAHCAGSRRPWGDPFEPGSWAVPSPALGILALKSPATEVGPSFLPPDLGGQEDARSTQRSVDPLYCRRSGNLAGAQ